MLSTRHQPRWFVQGLCSEPRDAQRCVEQGREAGGGYACYPRGTGCFPTVSAPPGLSSSSWEIYPKAPHIPSSIHTAQGDALIPVAFPHSTAAGSCLPALVRSQRQLSSHPPLTFLLESPLLIFSFGQLSPHLSQIHCMQCLSWAHTLYSPRYFRAHAQVSQNVSSAKQCLR